MGQKWVPKGCLLGHKVKKKLPPKKRVELSKKVKGYLGRKVRENLPKKERVELPKKKNTFAEKGIYKTEKISSRIFASRLKPIRKRQNDFLSEKGKLTQYKKWSEMAIFLC